MKGSNNLQIYRSCEPVSEAWYDPDGERGVLEVLVNALADVAGVDVTDLPPLYETIDTDALMDLFSDPRRLTEVVLGFSVENWHVFVHSDGRIRICDGAKATDPEPVFGTPSS